MLQPSEVRQLLDQASPKMRAMILLGLNCALGNSDIASLKLEHLDLDGGFLDFPRPKTGVGRRSSLWPETVQAIRQVVGSRDSGLVFWTARGNCCVRDRGTSRADAVGPNFAGLLKRCGLYRPGLSFYSLRALFRTVADGSLDTACCRLVMGHASTGMEEHYLRRIDDARLVKVAQHVHDWLYPTGTFTLAKISADTTDQELTDIAQQMFDRLVPESGMEK
jgi:integrase